MSLRRIGALFAFCAVMLTSGCCFDHGCCRRCARERDCGCPCECSCYGPADLHAAPPLAAPVIVAPPIMPGGGH